MIYSAGNIVTLNCSEDGMINYELSRSFTDVKYDHRKTAKKLIISMKEYNLERLEEIKFKRGDREMAVTDMVIGYRKNERIYSDDYQKDAIRYYCLDLDYESYKMFSALFGDCKYKEAHIEGVRPNNSVAFYFVVKTPKNDNLLSFLMSQFDVLISDELRESIENGSKKFIENKKKVRDIAKGIFAPLATIDYKNFTLKKDIVPKDSQDILFKMLTFKKGILLADPVGAGKTLTALIAVLKLENSLPCLIVVPNQLKRQWEERLLDKYFEGASCYIIKTGKDKIPSGRHFYICSYTLLAKVPELLNKNGIHISTIIGDEIEDIRNVETAKSKAFLLMSEIVNYCIGISGTPLGKMGQDIWAIMNRISQERSLGELSMFREQWIDGGVDLRNPEELREFLIKNGDMVSRTKKELGLDSLQKVEHKIEVDINEEDSTTDDEILVKLALKVLSKNKALDSSMGEFDLKVREETGIRKARSVAELAKIKLDSGEKVIITCWFRKTYEILQKILSKYGVVLISGSENTKQKEESKEKFIKDKNTKVLLISHFSGAGIDGFQQVCSTLIHSDFPYLVKIIEQLNGRILRPGQENTCEVFYPYINFGTDPFIMKMHQKQSAQIKGLTGEDVFSFEGVFSSEDDLDEDASTMIADGLKEVARNILRERKISFNEEVDFSDMHQKISNMLKKCKVHTGSESRMQNEIFFELKKHFPQYNIQREVSISKRSRLDFLIKDEQTGESIVIECKNNDKGKLSAYKQVERYMNELNHDATILFCPWFGVEDFEINGHKVEVINYLKN